MMDIEKRALEIEEERLAIERVRIELEKKRDFEDSYYRRWAENINVSSERQMTTALEAIDFGKFTLKSLMWLNGGAVIAYPALLGVLNPQDVKYTVFTLACFITGLILAVFGAILAYVSLINATKMLNAETLLRASEFEKRNQGATAAENIDDVIKNAKDKCHKFDKAGTSYEIAAFACGFVSLLAFGVGGYLGATPYLLLGQ